MIEGTARTAFRHLLFERHLASPDDSRDRVFDSESRTTVARVRWIDCFATWVMQNRYLAPFRSDCALLVSRPAPQLIYTLV